MRLSYRNLAPPSQAIRSTNKSVSNLIRFCSGMHDHLRELVLLQSHEIQGLLRLDLKSTIFHTDPILLSFPVLGPPENLTLVNVKHLSRNTSKAVVTWWPPHNIFSTDHIQEYRLTWRKIPILVGQMSEPHSDSTKLPPVSKNPVRKISLKFEGNLEMTSCSGRKLTKGVSPSKILNRLSRATRSSNILC